MTVTCFKTGKKSVYTYEHVNKLYNMVDRNTTHEFNFICFTDDPKGIESHIQTQPIRERNLNHWWHRLVLFKQGLLSGPCINIDLDVVIHNNIDELFELDDELYMVPNGIFGIHEYNDCVVKFNPDKHHYMWDKFLLNKDLYHNGGVDRFMTMLLKLGEHEHKTFPKEWFWRYQGERNKDNKFCHFIKLSEEHKKQHEVRDDEFVKEYWK
tara:strand:- start:612 stop:1241 length:630 start_codon:yes stop_codon:yes gene_type:complete